METIPVPKRWLEELIYQAEIIEKSGNKPELLPVLWGYIESAKALLNK